MKAAQKTKDEFLRLDTLRSELLRDLAVMAEQELSGIQLGTVDELTGFSNRRGFMALPQPTLNSCKRRSLSTCMFYFGLDQFKQINDR